MDNEWLSGDDEDDVSVLFMTLDILFKIKELDEKNGNKTHYLEMANKKKNEISGMVYFGRNSDLIYKDIIGKRLYPWKLNELEDEAAYLYRKRKSLSRFESSCTQIKKYVDDLVKLSPTLLKAKEAPQIILEFFDR